MINLQKEFINFHEKIKLDGENATLREKRDVLLKHKFEKSDFEKLWKELINEFKEFCNKKEIEVNEQHIEENIISAIDNTDEIILSNDKLDEKESVDGFEYAWYSFVREDDSLLLYLSSVHVHALYFDRT